MLAKRVQVVFCFQIRLMRFFWRSKQPQANRLVIDFDFCQPLVVFLTNTWKTTFVVLAFAVLRILRISGFTQIVNLVVTSVAVNVVQLMRGPFAVNVQPRQSMRGVQYVVQSDGYVPMPHAAANYISGTASPARHVPPKNAGFRVVGHERFKAVLRDSFAVHDLNNIRQVGDCQA